MGGMGSGRRINWGRGTVEECRSLDVNRLNRDGCLRAGYRGSRAWTCDGEQIANISLQYSGDTLRLIYRVRRNGGDWQDVDEAVRISWHPCRLGGHRPYFHCPGIVSGRHCGRTVAKLYGASTYFLCRHCYDLAYSSGREDYADRALRRANKLRRRLGGETGFEAPLLDRPKGMWQHTYNRVIDEIDRLEAVADEKFALIAMRLLKLENSQ